MLWYLNGEKILSEAAVNEDEDEEELEEMTVEFIKKANRQNIDKNAVYENLFDVDYGDSKACFIEKPFTYYHWRVINALR